MNKTNSSQSCLLPFKVRIDFGNNVFIFLFILSCLILALLFGYLLLKHKLSTADQAKNFIVLINEDLFYFYLGMLLPIVSYFRRICILFLLTFSRLNLPIYIGRAECKITHTELQSFVKKYFFRRQVQTLHN